MNDKKLILLIMAFILVFEYKFIYSPGRRKLEALDSFIAQKQSDMQLLEKLCAEYELKKAREEEGIVKIARPDFSLFSYLGKTVERKKLEKNITGIKPIPLIEKEAFQIEKIRLNLENITLQQIYDFLQEVENSENGVYVPEFRMRRNRDRQFLLGVEMELLSIKLIGG